MRSFRWIVVLLVTAHAAPLFGQMTVSGRVWMPRWEGADELYPFTTILAFASHDGSRHQTLAARTWETYPAGWYFFSGDAGRYTMAFGGPAHFMRPFVLTNQFLDHSEKEVVHHVGPRYDYAVFSREQWDGDEVSACYQTFVAKSTSVTNVGFNLVHDGVDGEAPQGQDFLVSVHRKGDGTPDTWEQIGRAVPVVGVDAGGVKSSPWGAGWYSGEVPLVPGETYAICVRPEDPDGTFQCFWREDSYAGGDCYRVEGDKSGWADRDMWMYIAGDGDGLVMPMQKSVKSKFYDLTKFGKRWHQTYRAQGHSLASVMMYVAVANTQPMLYRQRFNVRVRKGGPDGPVVGIPKIAKGQPTATGHGGVLGVSFSPGEVPVEPGETYAIELTAFGHHEGFNPYRLHERDDYPLGTSYFDGRKMDYDLDMTIIEYEHPAGNWTLAVHDTNLLHNGNMEQGELNPDDFDAGGPEGWTRFAIDPGTTWWYRPDSMRQGNRVATVLGGSVNGKTVDGGYVTAVEGLKRIDTYRVSGKVRSTWEIDRKHQVFVGVDPTGQVSDPQATTIAWSVFPGAESVWEDYFSEPVRPDESSISIWLRGRTTFLHNQPFEVDFDEFAVRRVRTGAPKP